jgi:hypothetical protein
MTQAHGVFTHPEQSEGALFSPGCLIAANLLSLRNRWELDRPDREIPWFLNFAF